MESTQKEKQQPQKDIMQIKSSYINDLLREINQNWNQQWLLNMQLFRNKIVLEPNAKVPGKPLPNRDESRTSVNQGKNGLLGADLLHIRDDPHQKLIIVEFSRMIRNPSPILRFPLITVDSMNSTLSQIDTDFYILVFKIINDRPFLLHYLPKAPDLVAYSEYEDSYNKLPNSGYKFEFKQLNWMIFTHAKSSKIVMTVLPTGLEVQFSFLKDSWYILIPAQNARETMSINVNEVLSIASGIPELRYSVNSIFAPVSSQQQVDPMLQEINLESVLDPLNRQKHYQYIIVREALLLLQDKTGLIASNLQDVLDSLNPTLIYNILLRSQLLINFPISKRELILTDIYPHIDKAPEDLAQVVHLYDVNSIYDANDIVYGDKSPHLSAREATSPFMDVVKIDSTVTILQEQYQKQSENDPQISEVQSYRDWYLAPKNLTGNLTLGRIRQGVQQCKEPFNIIIDIYDKDQYNVPILVKSFRLTTQRYLFAELCFSHLETLRSLDTLTAVKDVFRLYMDSIKQDKPISDKVKQKTDRNQKADIQSIQQIPKYQKIKYPISRHFIEDLEKTFNHQQAEFNAFISKMESILHTLKLTQLNDFIKIYHKPLSYSNVQQPGTKQYLLRYLINLMQDNNNSLVIPILTTGINPLIASPTDR